MPLDLPEKTHYEISVSQQEDADDTFVLDQKGIIALFQKEVGDFTPLAIENKTQFANLSATIDAESNAKFFVVTVQIDGRSYTCLFNRKDLRDQKTSKRSVYHQGKTVEIVLTIRTDTTFAAQALQPGYGTKNTVQGNEGGKSAGGVAQDTVGKDQSTELRGTRELREKYRIDARLDKVTGLISLYDGKGNLLDTIPQEKQESSQLIRTSQGVFRVYFRLLAPNNAEILAQPLDGVFFSARGETGLPDVQRQWTPEQRGFIGTISFMKGGKVIAGVSVKNLDFNQKTPWQSIIDSGNSPEAYRDFMSAGNVTIEGKQMKFVATADSTRPGQLKIALIEYTSEVICCIKQPISTTKRTAGTWLADPIYTKQGTIEGVKVSCLQYPALNTQIDWKDLQKAQKDKQSFTVKRTADGIEYTITVLNQGGVLSLTVDQITPFKEITDLEKIRKEHEKPIPPLPEPPKKKEKEKKKEEEKKQKKKEWEDEEDYIVHDEDPNDSDVLPTIDKNPWGDQSVNTENFPDGGLDIGGTKIVGFYEQPLPFAGANQSDLERFYFDHAGKSIFELMYDVHFSLINDTQREKENALNLEKNKQVLNGKLFTVKDDDEGEWLVKAYLSPDGKLGFFLRPPLKKLSNEGFKEGIVDGPPVALKRPSDDYTFKISSGMNKYGLQSTTKPRPGHSGIDIAGDFDTNVLAPAGAKVVYVYDGVQNPSLNQFKRSNGSYETQVGQKKTYGNYIVLQLVNGCFLLLGHLSPNIPVQPGQTVPAGYPLAKMGRTGHVITKNPYGRGGVHLHLEYFRGDDELIHYTPDQFAAVFSPGKGYKKYIKERFEPESLLLGKYQQSSGSSASNGGKSTPTESKNTAITPIEHKVGETQYGRATVYKESEEGDATASGKTFSHSKSMAAHNSLPFGSQVEVKNLDNGITTIVTIEDNGGFGETEGSKTIIDLSQYSMNILCKGCKPNDKNPVKLNNIQITIKKLGDKLNPKAKESSNNSSSSNTENKTISLDDYGVYLKKAPEKQKTSFSFQGQNFESYNTRIRKDPKKPNEKRFGEVTGSAPFGWLIGVDQGKVYIIHPTGKFEITGKSLFKVKETNYRIEVEEDIKNPDAAYPKRAIFKFIKQ